LKRRKFVTYTLLALAWIAFLGQPTGFPSAVRNLLVRLITPFTKLGDLIPVIRSGRELAKQNDQLRTTNADLRRQLADLQAEREQNLRFRGLLAFKDLAPWKLLGARVIGRDAANWWQSLQLDRGASDGIRRDQPVVTTEGLVGKIIAVTGNESRALMLADPDCRVSAYLETSREPGIVAGQDTAFRRDPRLQMTFVQPHATIHVGERVITSGLGGVFPRGIVLGTVAGAKLNPQTGMYQDVEIIPVVDYRRLEEVMVIVE
jgi:rod shape-determining protein MreC